MVWGHGAQPRHKHMNKQTKRNTAAAAALARHYLSNLRNFAERSNWAAIPFPTLAEMAESAYLRAHIANMVALEGGHIQWFRVELMARALIKERLAAAPEMATMLRMLRGC